MAATGGPLGLISLLAGVLGGWTAGRPFLVVEAGLEATLASLALCLAALLLAAAGLLRWRPLLAVCCMGALVVCCMGVLAICCIGVLAICCIWALCCSSAPATERKDDYISRE